MKRFLVLFVAFLFVSAGCGRKAEEASIPCGFEEMAVEVDALPIESRTRGTEIQPRNSALELPRPVESKIESVEVIAQEPKPAATGAKPTIEEIQAALKNAGLYQGKIDGILGSKTKKAVVDFQTQNNLKPDGKVGPKTWEKMKAHIDKTAGAN